MNMIYFRMGDRREGPIEIVLEIGKPITLKLINVIVPTVCPRSLDPFYVVSNFIKWLRILGQHSTFSFAFDFYMFFVF